MKKDIPVSRSGEAACYWHIKLIPVGQLFILCIAAMWLASSAHAAGTPEQQQQLRALYAELLANPTDVDRTLAYAELAVEMENYEAAIPPLERLLLTHPNSTKLKLELGVMYYLLDAFDAARPYLQDVKNHPQAEPALRQQAGSYLMKMGAGS